MKTVSSLSVLALVQFLVICIGVLVTCGMLKLSGYGGHALENTRWNPLSLAIRDWGWLLVLVPVAWTTGCVGLERRAGGRWTRGWTVFSGAAVAVMLSAMLFHAASEPI